MPTFLMNKNMLSTSAFLLVAVIAVIIVLINRFLLFIAPYRQEGWASIRDRFLKVTIPNFQNDCREFNLITYIKTRPILTEVEYVALGAYFLVFTFTSIYSTHPEMLKENKTIITTFFKIMIVSSTMMGMYPIWPLSVKTEIKETIIRIWHPLAMFYMLIFLSTFFVLLNKVNNLHYIMFALNMLGVIRVFGWKMSLPMVATGTYMGMKFYKYYAGIDELDTGVTTLEFMLISALAFMGLTLVNYLAHEQNGPRRK